MLKVILALFFGETLAILGELLAAKEHPWTGLALGAIGWPLLVWSYYTGYKAGGIWQITATSVGAILIAEPILILLMFREAPGRHALIGCLLGAVGIVIASIKD